MLILSRVCAEFTDKSGAVIHRITPAMLGLFHDAPEALKGDLLFEMLLKDGSIKTPEDAKKDKELEHNPMKGATADGREIVAASGGSSGDFEVSRNKRAVRGTVAPIEAADKDKVPEKEIEYEPDPAVKAEKGTKTAKAETKVETKAETKPAEGEQKK